MNSETDTASEITLSRNGFSSMAPPQFFLLVLPAWVIFFIHVYVLSGVSDDTGPIAGGMDMECL